MIEISEIQNIVQSDSSSEEFAWYADVLRQHGQVAEALEVLEIGLAKNPVFIPAWIVKAKCFEDSSKISEARELCAQILEMDERCLFARHFLLDAAIQIGQIAEAHKIAQRIRIQDPWFKIPEIPENSTATAIEAPNIAFAAPPLVDDLFDADLISEDPFSAPIAPVFDQELELPDHEAELPPLILPTTDEVSNAFENLFDEPVIASPITDISMTTVSAEKVEVVEEPALVEENHHVLDLAPEDVSNAFDELFGDDGLGSDPAFAETSNPESFSQSDFSIPANDPNVMEISIADAHADLLDIKEEEIDPLGSLFGDDDNSSTTPSPTEFSVASIEETPLSSLADLDFSEPDLHENVDSPAQKEDDQEFKFIDVDKSPLENLLAAEEDEVAKQDIFGLSESAEPMPFFEGEIENELETEPDHDSVTSALDNIFGSVDEEKPFSFAEEPKVEEINESAFEFEADVTEELPTEEEATTPSQSASGQTITLAEIYCSQGLYKQALSIYQGVLAQKEDETLRARYAEIEELLRNKESEENEI